MFLFRALQLDDFPGITPLFENMVLLETAWHVWISLVTTMIPVGIILAERELAMIMHVLIVAISAAALCFWVVSQVLDIWS
jgi:hypothetical protein